MLHADFCVLLRLLLVVLQGLPLSNSKLWDALVAVGFLFLVHQVIGFGQISRTRDVQGLAKVVLCLIR